MQSLEDGTRDWCGAVICVDDGGSTPIMFRPAAFVFDVPGGLAWVEPSYADPAGAQSPAFHVLAGGARSEWNLFAMPSGRTVQVLAYDPQDNRDLVGVALDWFAAWLKDQGRTWADERERVRQLVADELS